MVECENCRETFEDLRALQRHYQPSGQYHSLECPYVECDENCKAKVQPQTFEEYQRALEHWRDHRHLAGCSHGC